MGKLFIISGPSGAGKSTILNSLVRRLPRLYFSVSVTTRPPRNGEVNGTHYHFVSGSTFEQMVADDGFLEYSGHLGAFYGTPRSPVEEQLAAGWDVILDIETIGARNVFAKVPEAVGVFVFPDSFAVLEARLRARGTDSEEKIAMRLEKARIEYEERSMYKYVVLNIELDRAIAECEAIIKKERGSIP